MSLAKTGWHYFRVPAASAGDYAPGVLTGTITAGTVFFRPAVVKEVIVNLPTGGGSVEIHDVTKGTFGALPAAAAARVVLKIADIPTGLSSFTIPVDLELKQGFFLRTVGAGIDVTIVFRPMGRTAPDHPKVFIQRR